MSTPSAVRLDADRIELNKLLKILETGVGQKQFHKHYDDFVEKNPACAFRIYEAFYPHKALNALKDALANAGLTAEDLKAMIAKAGPKATKQ